MMTRMSSESALKNKKTANIRLHCVALQSSAEQLAFVNCMMTSMSSSNC
jgi:hypothetical protein